MIEEYITYNNYEIYRVAIHHQAIQITQWFFLNGISINECNHFAICSASIANKNFLQYIIDYGADVNYDNNFPLMHAGFNNNIDNIKLLLNNGASFDEINFLDLIRYHINHKNFDMFKFLVDINNGFFINNTEIINHCVQYNLSNYVKILLEIGVNVNNINVDDLKYVIRKKNMGFDLLKLLSDYDFNFDILNNLDTKETKYLDLLENQGVNMKFIALLS
ncbi:hypothetical protein [Powai lake megavirus]|uniref:Uncharacterized protein n=1 Tax=Powai lake megavirus TaxID=1842663 RepID=A0A167R515_9VIRU|nr:hypothetical protein QJ849_gp155 [Powai lake megavirus]ANB50317.1 hypothetical protein [Powai lake megavirus]